MRCSGNTSWASSATGLLGRTPAVSAVHDRRGIFGITLSTASTAIVVFILFGAFLSVSGATALFNDLALAAAGRRRGGPARGGDLVGTDRLVERQRGGQCRHHRHLHHSADEKHRAVVPLRRRRGSHRLHRRHDHAPIMGAAAFIMAGFLGISYTTIVIAAIVPALLYYAALIMAIDLEAKKQGLKGINKENIPQVRAVLKARGLLLLPLVIVIGTLLLGKTPIYAGFLGIIAIIVASWLTPDSSVRMTPKKSRWP